MTATWAPGDPVYERDAERGVCADPFCGTSWCPPADDIEVCPVCGGPPKDPKRPQGKAPVDSAVDNRRDVS